MLLPQIGEAGQQRLVAAHALLIGCGALGCGIADLLVRAGIGTLSIVDRDVVELTNLQRQSLFEERDARDASPKAEAAAARLRRVNSLVRVIPYVLDFSSGDAEAILGGALAASPAPPPVDLIVDGTDNFAARYLMNDLAVKRGLPFVYGGAVSTGGMTMTVIPRVSPCLRCLFPESPGVGSAMTCDTAGILGPAAAVISALQAAEVIKVLTAGPSAASRHLIEVDVWTGTRRTVDLSGARDPACVCCAQGRFEYLDGSHDADAAVICTRVGGGAVQIRPSSGSCAAPRASARRLDLPSIAARLAPHGTFLATPHVLRGTLPLESHQDADPIELTLFSDGRAIIRGTVELGIARAIYARYVGE